MQSHISSATGEQSDAAAGAPYLSDADLHGRGRRGEDRVVFKSPIHKGEGGKYLHHVRTAAAFSAIRPFSAIFRKLLRGRGEGAKLRFLV